VQRAIPLRRAVSDRIEGSVGRMESCEFHGNPGTKHRTDHRVIADGLANGGLEGRVEIIAAIVV
jgi:hypothetical protein